MFLELLNDLESNGHLRAHPRKCLQFMLSCVRPISHCLSVAARDGLAVAERLLTEDVPAEEVASVRVACWQELDAAGKTYDTDTPEACATRAVICLLYPDELPKDPFDSMDLLVELTNKVENHEDEQERTLRQLFSDQMGRG